MQDSDALKIMLEGFGNNEMILKNFLTSYMKEEKVLQEKIQKQYSEKEYADLAETLHEFKGLVSYFNAEEVVETFDKLEQASRNQDINSEVLEKLDLQLGGIKQTAEQFLQKLNS